MDAKKTQRTRLFYRAVTGLMAAFMLLAAIPDVLMLPDAVTFFTHLGYPAYLLPFIGVAKALGVAAILVPNFPKLKEWAYAGLVFDLVGAFYSHTAVGDPFHVSGFALLALVLVVSSYALYRKEVNAAEVRLDAA